MSDEMDDMEKFADAVSLRTGIRSARGMAGFKNCKKFFERVLEKIGEAAE